MEAIDSVSGTRPATLQQVQAHSTEPQSHASRAIYLIYLLAIALSISFWLIPIRAPLLLDETGSYWQISAGFSQIWARHMLSFPGYTWLLWASSKVIGTSEAALRVPSILAMLGAAYLFYQAARELFDREVAIIAAGVFCIHPIIIFEAINIRPYAFAVLMTNAAILILFRLRVNNSNWMAALFGLSAAFILYFHYMFAAIFPAFIICFFIIKAGNRNALRRQLVIAVAVCGIALLPVIPILLYVLRTSGTHIYAPPGKLSSLVWTLAPGWPAIILGIIALIALLITAGPKRRNALKHVDDSFLLCASLAFIPLLLLFALSKFTSVHIFELRYRAVAVPGIALCWAFVFSRIRRPVARSLFYIAVMAGIAVAYFMTSYSQQYQHSWKYALNVIQHNASVDNASVLICSNFVESNYAPMPLDSPKDSFFLAPISYYKLSVPVVPLPKALNDEAIRVGSQFLQEAALKHERFLALADTASGDTLIWLTQRTSKTYSAKNLGTFDGVTVMEFVPRDEPKIAAQWTPYRLQESRDSYDVYTRIH